MGGGPGRLLAVIREGTGAAVVGSDLEVGTRDAATRWAAAESSLREGGKQGGGPVVRLAAGPHRMLSVQGKGGKEPGAVAALSRPQLPRGVCGPRRVGSESGVTEWPLVWLPGALGDLPAFMQDTPGPAQMTFVVGGGWASVPGRAREASLERPLPGTPGSRGGPSREGCMAPGASGSGVGADQHGCCPRRPDQHQEEGSVALHTAVRAARDRLRQRRLVRGGQRPAGVGVRPPARHPR